MTETKKTVRKSGGAKKAPKRDAYDDFLDMTEAPAPSSGTRKKSASSKKAGSSSASGKGSAAAKPASKGKATAAAKPASKGKTTAAAKPASKGKATAAAKPAPKKSAAKKPSSDHLESRSTLKDGAGKKAGQGASRSTRGSAGASAAKARSSTSGKRPSGKKPSGSRRTSGEVLYVGGGRDAYDDFLAESAPKKGRRKRRKGSVGLALALIAGILCIIGLGAWQTMNYRTFQVMQSAVATQQFYDGTTVEGVDVSGMTYEQALAHWEQQIEPQYAGRTVTLSNGAAFTAAELGYRSDYAAVLSAAWSAGRTGSLEERYEMLSARRDRPVSYSVTRTPYSSETIAACVGAIAGQIDSEAKNARIESFNPSNFQFTFTEESVGSRLDQGKLAADMAAALDAGGGSVELPVLAVQPTVRKADIQSQYGLITHAVTNASSSNKNRLNNIRLALASINGVCLAPGETFSFNETVGKRTTERGYKVATAYAGGEVTEEVGGGICQVSTTLFNAAVKADLEIVERHNHSLTVSYVDKGKDAAVNWNSQDLRFTNNTGDNIYICCFLTDDKRVRVGVFGKLLPNGETITVEGVTTESIPYETVHQPSLSLAPGAVQVTQKGKEGYKAVAYKIRWDASGKEISRELLCRSTYKAVKEIIEYGP